MVFNKYVSKLKKERESKRVVFEFHKEFSQHVRLWKKRCVNYKVPILLVCEDLTKKKKVQSTCLLELLKTFFGL